MLIYLLGFAALLVLCFGYLVVLDYLIRCEERAQRRKRLRNF